MILLSGTYFYVDNNKFSIIIATIIYPVNLCLHREMQTTIEFQR